jgi:hypothetical protein
MTSKTINIRQAGAKPRVTTSYRYKDVNRVRNVTRYKDINRTRHVTRINRIVTVTRVQPVIRTNVVTRVNHRTVVVRQTQNLAQTRVLPMRTITTSKTIQIRHKPTISGMRPKRMASK